MNLRWADFLDERSPKARALAWTCIGAFSLVMLVTCAINARSLWLLRDSDFPHFYFAAQAMVRGEDIYASNTRGYIYPPLFALLITPLTPLGRGAAGATWTVLSCLLAFASVWCMGKETCARLRLASTSLVAWGMGSLVQLANIDKLRITINWGQTDTLTFFLIALAYRLERRFPLLCGALLGVACNIKYHTIVFLAYFLVRARWRECAGLVAGLVVGGLAAAPVVGWNTNLDYLARALSGFPRMLGMTKGTGDEAQMNSLTWLPSVSIPSGLARVIGHQERPVLFASCVGLTAVATFATGWWLYAKRGFPLFAGRGGSPERELPRSGLSLAEWSGLLVATALFSPQSTGRHYYITTLALCMNAAVLMFPRAGVARWPIVVAWLIYFLGLTLPPGTDSLQWAIDVWRRPAGPAWCVLAAFMIMVYQYLRWLAAEPRCDALVAQEVPRG